MFLFRSLKKGGFTRNMLTGAVRTHFFSSVGVQEEAVVACPIFYLPFAEKLFSFVFFFRGFKCGRCLERAVRTRMNTLDHMLLFFFDFDACMDNYYCWCSDDTL